MDADTNANAGGSTIALREHCSGKLKKTEWQTVKILMRLLVQRFLFWFTGLKRLLTDQVEVLWPSQPIRVMLSQSVYLTTHFLGRLSPLTG